MKKIISTVLILSMCIGMSNVAYADPEPTPTAMTLTSIPYENDLEVKASFTKPAPTYSVTLTWGTMKYRYVDPGMTWDDEEHMFKTSNSGKWYPVKANGEIYEIDLEDEVSRLNAPNTVSIQNDSDVHISVDVSFTPDSTNTSNWKDTNNNGTEEGVELTYKQEVWHPTDKVYIDMSKGNLCTQLDSAGKAAKYYGSHGHMNIYGRPEYIKKLNQSAVKLGDVKVTIGGYNSEWNPSLTTNGGILDPKYAE